MSFIFWVSILVLWYVYDGYLRLLRLLCGLRGSRPQMFPPLAETALPSITVLLTVHNEETVIARRLDNLLAQDYPLQKMQIIVASDGSTDNTNAIVAEYARTQPVRLIASDRMGKSGAQNRAAREATGSILLLTDAATRFALDYLRKMAAPFADASVGCVTAQALFETAPGILSRGQGYYWNYELELRERESRLGLLAIASGNAMALRRSLFRDLPFNVGDDCIIPLDVVLAGQRVVHQQAALAYDVMEHDPRHEFKSRVRMTLRNWTGMWLRPQLLNPLAYPGYAVALWSHKLLRWLGSVFLLLLAISSYFLALQHYLPAYAFLLFVLLVLAGFLKSRGTIALHIPGAGLAYSFTVANLGFLTGLCKAAAGHTMTHYRSGR